MFLKLWSLFLYFDFGFLSGSSCSSSVFILNEFKIYLYFTFSSSNLPPPLLQTLIEKLTIHWILAVVGFWIFLPQLCHNAVALFISYFHFIFNLCTIGIKVAIILIKTALFKVVITGKTLSLPLTISRAFSFIKHKPGSIWLEFIHYCISTSAIERWPYNPETSRNRKQKCFAVLWKMTLMMLWQKCQTHYEREFLFIAFNSYFLTHLTLWKKM